MAKKKSKVDINVVEDLLKRGYTYKQIAIETNSSLNNIRYLAIKNGLDKYSKHRRLAHALEKDVIEKHLKQGLTYTDIGKIYGFSGQTIGSLAHQYGLDEYNVAKSYKYLNINIIKDLLINGESYFSIAAKIGVGERYIRKICEENGIDKFNSNIRHIYYIYPIDSAIKAYILGFIICDASINYNNSVKIKISAIDYYTLSMIANELGSKILVDTNFITKNGTCSDIIRTIKTIYNIDNIKIDAGNCIEVNAEVYLPNISIENVSVETYYGKILENGIVEDVSIIPMELVDEDEEERKYYFSAKIKLTTGGNYGYTFRVMPKHEMLLEPSNLNLVTWITKSEEN